MPTGSRSLVFYGLRCCAIVFVLLVGLHIGLRALGVQLGAVAVGATIGR